MRKKLNFKPPALTVTQVYVNALARKRYRFYSDNFKNKRVMIIEGIRDGFCKE